MKIMRGKGGYKSEILDLEPSGRGRESRTDTCQKTSGIEKLLRYLVVGCVLGWGLVESEVLVGPMFLLLWLFE